MRKHLKIAYDMAKDMHDVGGMSDSVFSNISDICAPTCHLCGKKCVRDTRLVTFSYKGISRDVQMPGWYCEKCGEGIHTMGDMEASDAALADMKKELKEK